MDALVACAVGIILKGIGLQVAGAFTGCWCRLRSQGFMSFHSG